jgi:hypothetical protein
MAGNCGMPDDSGEFGVGAGGLSRFGTDRICGVGARPPPPPALGGRVSGVEVAGTTCSGTG